MVIDCFHLMPFMHEYIYSWYFICHVWMDICSWFRYKEKSQVWCTWAIRDMSCICTIKLSRDSYARHIGFIGNRRNSLAYWLSIQLKRIEDWLRISTILRSHTECFFPPHYHIWSMSIRLLVFVIMSGLTWINNVMTALVRYW